MTEYLPIMTEHHLCLTELFQCMTEYLVCLTEPPKNVKNKIFYQKHLVLIKSEQSPSYVLVTSVKSNETDLYKTLSNGEF